MISYQCFLCSARIGQKHVMDAIYMDGRRHEVRLCYGCGLPDLEAGGMLGLIQSHRAVVAKLREIKTLEV